MSQNVGRFEALFSAPQEKPAASTVLGREAPPDVDMGPPVGEAHKDTYMELERKYRHRTYQAQELMIEKLLRGHFIDMKALERKLNMFDLHFEHGRFLVVLVRAVSNDATFSSYASDIRDGGQVGLIVSSIFSELLGERYACFPANLEDRYAFLLNFSNTDDAAVSARWQPSAGRASSSFGTISAWICGYVSAAAVTVFISFRRPSGRRSGSPRTTTPCTSRAYAPRRKREGPGGP